MIIIWSSYIAITKSFTMIWYMPISHLAIMIILDQDLFSIEVILSNSETLRPLTTSDEDGLRIELSRTLEFFPTGLLKMTCAPFQGFSEKRIPFWWEALSSFWGGHKLKSCSESHYDSPSRWGSGKWGYVWVTCSTLAFR